jgi:UDP-N-acetylglucosamine--N-acetylmuramyl-(pentapeptide) pyrophosphoryl-undecaprenol N-acetylglucosamine transferase
MVTKRYRELGISAQVKVFFTAMDQVYEQASFLVSRAGATTLSEIAVLGLPAILIPYPYAADNHQQTNADYYVEGGAALQFKESELTAQRLGAEIASLLQRPDRLAEMSAAMRRLAFPDAARDLVANCLDLIGDGG